MSWYQVMYGGVVIGDELVSPFGHWSASAKPSGGGGLEPIVPVDDRPLGLVLYPRFRIRKKASDMFAFEQWLFDLATWANGDPRWLIVINDLSEVKVEYGLCKLFSLDRPRPTDTSQGRWSDQVVVTFQADTIPRFYNVS